MKSTRWLLLAEALTAIVFTILLYAIIDLRSERDALREEVNQLEAKVKSYNYCLSTCQSQLIRTTQDYRHCKAVLACERHWTSDCRPDSEATYTDWDDIVFKVTGRNRFSVDMPCDTTKKFVRVKAAKIPDGEPMDSTRLDSIYQEIIVKPLQKWIDEHRTYRIQITIPKGADE